MSLYIIGTLNYVLWLWTDRLDIFERSQIRTIVHCARQFIHLDYL